MAMHECRACRGQAGDLVLDLGAQPACDYFPEYDDPGPDPVYASRRRRTRYAWSRRRACCQ